MIELAGVGWDHERCMAPLRACSAAWQSDVSVAIRWSARPLSAFEDQPLEELAAGADLLVIDHPHCGAAAAAGALRPLDGLLDEATLDALDAASAGPSHASYRFEGRQWALAADAACMVAAAREDLLGGRPLPRTWSEAVALAEDEPGRTALPLAPAHAICAFLALCAAHGAPLGEGDDRLVAPDAGAHALATLQRLHDAGHADAARWSPPEMLARMRTSDELVYCPLAFGYVSYARSDGDGRPLRFSPPPHGPDGHPGSVLGGAGLAVSGFSRHPELAAAFAAFTCSPEIQRTIVGPAGGQPGARAAWRDASLDAAANGFFSATLPILESAWVRPRAAWWPIFQDQAGRLLAAALREGRPPAATLRDLEPLGPRPAR